MTNNLAIFFRLCTANDTDCMESRGRCLSYQNTSVLHHNAIPSLPFTTTRHTLTAIHHNPPYPNCHPPQRAIPSLIFTTTRHTLTAIHHNAPYPHCHPPQRAIPSLPSKKIKADGAQCTRIRQVQLNKGCRPCRKVYCRIHYWLQILSAVTFAMITNITTTH